MMAPTMAIQRAKVTQHAALAALLVMGGLAIAGPSGLLAWSENLRLLDPNHADPDMVGELLRSQLNVVHPDEVVIKLED